MFHGTLASNVNSIKSKGFEVSPGGMLGKGVYTTRQFDKARKYPLNVAGDKVVFELRVKTGRVKKISSVNDGNNW